ncbi:hypothetical protein [Odoribacter lunatus]|uniref:hypothetical protein n=1 Tax=Odoribacter lunatus TaxID=2941335 RepID=UPI00203D50ED|nr:hypothetical protein [Odoribacter lunatus]
MASIRRLKKDINYVSSAIISDCFRYCVISGKDDEEVREIIRDTITTRDELLVRTRGAKRLKDRKEIRNNFKAIFRDLLSNADAAFNKLSGIIKAV